MLSVNQKRKPSLRIKENPEDFIVKEITTSLKILETGTAYSNEDLSYAAGTRFTVFALQKKNWNTLQALGAVSNALGKGRKSTGFAGTKDRRALSVQLCSITDTDPERLLALRIPDIQINFAWKSDMPVKLGDLEGNRFEITARGGTEEATDSVNLANSELNGMFPNYYGTQRFGSRGNNVAIGLALLKGDFEEAVIRFLTNSSNESNEDAREARSKLASELDFSKALQYFPKYLKYERQMLSYLALYGPNYRAALRVLPRQLLMMLVHSVESEIFNKTVEAYVKEGHVYPRDGDLYCNADRYGFPDCSKVSTYKKGDKGFITANIVGYETKELSEAEKNVLGEYGISKESFRLKQIPELRAKGSFRAVFAPYKDFSVSEGPDSITIKFSLPSGSYATVLLSEFVHQAW
ncbi:MAG: tRNA pseudouridine(13) synthase TruD [Candidatus Marsarchaeota archaeon]|nr:tRNA pseudouridine(13) synthase TruD [Candidatus Marsarchaeota archaeon]